MPPKPQPRRRRASAKRRQSSNGRLRLPPPLTQPVVRQAVARSRSRARSLLPRAHLRLPHSRSSPHHRSRLFRCSRRRPRCLRHRHLCSRSRWLLRLLCQHQRHSRSLPRAGCLALQAALRVWPRSPCRRHSRQRLHGLALWARYQPGCCPGALHLQQLPPRPSLQQRTPRCRRPQTQLRGLGTRRCRPLLRRRRPQMRRTPRCWLRKWRPCGRRWLGCGPRRRSLPMPVWCASMRRTPSPACPAATSACAPPAAPACRCRGAAPSAGRAWPLSSASAMLGSGSWDERDENGGSFFLSADLAGGLPPLGRSCRGVRLKPLRGRDDAAAPAARHPTRGLSPRSSATHRDGRGGA